MKAEPYSDAIKYLEDELGRYLPLRVARLNAERQVKDLTSDILDGKSEKSRQRANVLEAKNRAKQLLELDMRKLKMVVTEAAAQGTKLLVTWIWVRLGRKKE